MHRRILKGRQSSRKALNHVSWRTYRKLLGRLCADHVGNEFADSISGLLRNKNYAELYAYADSLVSRKLDTAKDHFLANQFAALVRKYPFPSSVINLQPRENALKKFVAAEERCAQVNDYFLNPIRDRGLEFHLSRMRQFIAYVIGDIPDVTSCLSSCDFGPGANIGVNGDGTSSARKLLAKNQTIGPCALPYLPTAIMYNSHLVEFFSSTRSRSHYSHDIDSVKESLSKVVNLVAFNKITFVPKTTKTYRSIAVEPLWNSFLQKGVDVFMRKRLKRIGIDLSDQSSNVSFAQRGSVEWTSENPFCTLDLSSASDSISVGLVKELVPPDWYSFLNCIRSSSYLLDGVVHSYSKFCSMGNGFCFPLETLIFAAACHSVGCGAPGTDFLVYGDDIIVRRDKYDELVRLLDLMGFSVNHEKSFNSGPFRESCGGDFFQGEDVRPVTLDYELSCPENIFKLLNLSNRNVRTKMFFQNQREFLFSLLDPNCRLIRPFDGPADTAITSTGDEHLISPFCRWNKTHQRWEWFELLASPVPDDFWIGSSRADTLHVIAALRGSSPSSLFAWRRKTRTSVRKISHG